MTKIEHSAFELCERKEQVGRSVGRSDAYKLQLLKAVTTALCGHVTEGQFAWVWHDTPKLFSSVAHRFGVIGRNMLQWPPDNYNKVFVAPQ